MLTISTGSGWNDTSRGTRVPTEIAKLTLVTGRMFCSLITVLILVRCSVESFAPAPACPMVWDLPSAPFVSAFMLPLRSSRPSAFVPVRSSRPSALRSLAPLALSELMLFDFSPFMSLSWADLSPFGAALMSSCARWFLAAAGGCSDCVALAPGAGLVGCSDCVAFMPDDGLVGSAASRAAGAAEGAACSDGGALCCAVDPADGASRPIPVPCALANPVPAISAAAATDIIKRLVMEHLLTSFALPAPTTSRDARCSVLSAVPPGLFCECAMNASALKIGQHERPAVRPAFQFAYAAGSTDRGDAQHVALPQRAMPIFSFRPSRPTAPTTTCLPIT